MKPSIQLPTFLIIGVSRSGTTSLYRYLSAHPSVFMAPGKEIKFFSRHFDEGLNAYARHFERANSQQHRGEATPSYFDSSDVPMRVAMALPAVQLILSLRHPVDRAYSSYWLHVERGRQGRTFDDLISEELSVGSGLYLSESKYVTHLDQWLVHHKREKLQVLFFEHLVINPAEVYRSVCRFLEIEEIVPAVVGEVINEYRRVRSPYIRRWAKRFPKKIQDAVGRVNSKAADYPPVTARTRRQLLEFFAPYNALLEDRLGTSLPASWSE